MIRINLLPIKQIKKRIRLRNEVAILVASFFAVLVILGTISYAMSQKADGLNNEIKTLEKKKASYRPILNQIARLQRDKKNLETKLNTIEQLKKGSQLTVRILDEVANRTPTSRLWLQSFKQSGGQLQLTGVALDNETIAQYMKQLNSSPFFADIDLANSSQTVIAGNKLKSFSLTFRVTPPSNEEQSPQQE